MGKPFAVSIQQLHDLKVDRIGYQLKKKLKIGQRKAALWEFENCCCSGSLTGSLNVNKQLPLRLTLEACFSAHISPIFKRFALC